MDKFGFETHVVAFKIEPIIRCFGTVNTVTRRRVSFPVFRVCTTSTDNFEVSDWYRRD